MQKELKNLLDAGKSHLEDGEYDLAIENIEKAIALDPQRAELYYYLGCVYDKTDNYKLAIDLFQKAIDLNPNQKEAYCAIALIYQLIYRQYEEAILYYERLLSIDDKYFAAYYSLGDIFYKNEKYDKTIEILKTGISKGCEEAAIYNNIGAAYDALNDLDEAGNYFKQAIRMNSRYIPAYVNLANLYFNQKEFQQALDTCQEVLILYPDLEDARNCLEKAQKELGIFKQECL